MSHERKNSVAPFVKEPILAKQSDYEHITYPIARYSGMEALFAPFVSTNLPFGDDLYISLLY